MKIKCKKCGEVIEGDKKGTYITCKCKAIAIDETIYYCRINGNLEDYEEIKENENKENKQYEYLQRTYVRNKVWK